MRRLETDTRELAQQVRLLRRQARTAKHRHGLRAVRLLDAIDLCRRSADRVGIRHGTEALRRRRIAPERSREAIGMRSLQVAFHALRAEHAAVERKLLPRFEPNHLIVANLQLNAALLAAEATVRLHEPFRLRR